MTSKLAFNTDALPERDRFAVFCEEIIRRYAALDITPRGDRLFRGVIDMQRVGPVAVSSRFSTPANYVRTPRFIGDGNDAVFVVLCRSGGAHQSQLGFDQKLEPGDAVLLDCGYTGGFHVTSDSSFYNLKVPRAAVANLRPDLKRLAGIRLDRDRTARRLLFGYLDGALSAGLVDDAPATRLFGEHLVDLIGLALGADGEARQLAEERGVRAARRAAILREIGDKAADRSLTAATVALRLGVTPRYVRMLLEETGRSFSEHVLDRRLERAAAVLRNPAHAYRKISDIALDCGFNDLSYFNRAFRRRYGVTPSDRREGARRDRTTGPRSDLDC
jgi:AraC-like DNA-binding protein